MALQHDRRFMYWGINEEEQGFGVPFPSGGSFEVQRFADTARNANGAMVATMLGRPNEVQNMEWNVMDTELWWQMNRWLEENGMFFWCRYFSHAVGKWRIRRFYVSDSSAVPYMVNALSGVPQYMRNVALSVFDMGA